MREETNLEEAIFAEALLKTSEAERAAFLEGACRNDPHLRERLETMLEGHFQVAGFLETFPVTVSSPHAVSLTEQPVSGQPGQKIGRYKLLQQLGEGGCGVVYMAEQEEPVRRRVALKVIKLGMDTKQVIARFEAERQALALMDHPHIAKVLDAGATNSGRPYFVMELVRGVKITEYCDQANLPTEQRLELFLQVCHAIQHAHQKGIIHRDIKPSNILVTLHDGVPVPKVIDFGIAKATTDQRLTDKTLFTAFEQFIGTPAYMSPEQAEMSGLDIDTRSDIYSLGVLLYELLTGKTPFDGRELLAAGIDQMRRTIREQEPLRPSTKLATLKGEEQTTTAKRRSAEVPKLIHLVKGDLDWIVMKCLEKDRSRRYETANGLAMDLKRHLSNEPVVACPPSAAYRFQKAWRRNKLAYSAGLTVTVALVIGITTSTWQAMVATRARNKAMLAEAEREQEARIAQQERDKAQAARQQAEEQRLRAEKGEVEAQQLLYAANMGQAQLAWEQNDASRVRQLLEDSAQDARRGFEWYYWQRQIHLELKTLRGHTAPILAVAYSRDGRWIVTGSADRTAQVWDAVTGQQLHNLRGHFDPIRTVAFSSDGEQIFTSDTRGNVKIWSASSGTNLLTFKGQSGRIFSAAFSPDDQRIVTGGEDPTVKVWNASTGNVIRTLKGHTARVLSVAISPDGRRIATGSWDRTIKVWNANSGDELRILGEHQDAVYAVAFSPNGDRIISGSWDHSAKVWAAVDGRLLSTISGHAGPVTSVTFSRDGLKIATAGEDQTARVWDANGQHELLAVKRHGSPISAVVLSPDGQQMITAGGSRGLSPDGNETPGGDRAIKVWETSGDRDLRKLKGHTGKVMSMGLARDGARIVTGGEDGIAIVWDTTSGRQLFPLNGHGGAIRGLAISPDGQWIATASWDRTVKVWEMATGKLVRTFDQHSILFMSVAFSPDSQCIVACGQDHHAKVWDVASGAEKLTITGEPGWIWSAVYSPDGHQILTANEDPERTAMVWDANSGTNLLILRGHAAWPASAAFSRDGSRIVTAGHDHVAKVWDVATGTNLLTLKGHSGFLLSATFSPDGQRIVTGSHDGMAKVWDAISGKELLTLKGHGGWVFSAAFTPDGRRIVTANADGVVRVWEAASPEQVASWRKEDEAAAELAAASRRAEASNRALRALDPGIKQWLVLAPLPCVTTNGAITLDQEQIPQEAQLRPRAGERVTVGRDERIWSAVQPKNHLIDFNELAGKETAFSVAYAVCYLVSEMDQPGLVMRVGSDDQAKIFLNGREIYRHLGAVSWEPDRDQVPQVELKAGINVLVFKVVNETGGWGGSVRFTDADGLPVKGIRAVLTPP